MNRQLDSVHRQGVASTSGRHSMQHQPRGCYQNAHRRRSRVVTRVAAPPDFGGFRRPWSILPLSKQPAPVPPPVVEEKKAVVNPFAEKVVYKDNWLDLLFIKLFSRRMASMLGGNIVVGDKVTYEGDFVRVSKEIMRGRNSVQQRDVIRKILMSILPPGITHVFKFIFPPSKIVAEFNALIASIGFKWLVGDMEWRKGDVQVSPTEVRQQRSIVHIKKCRYLEASGCVGMCVNMCKVPTQSFFTDEFGLPLTMVPNFEDLSCDMIFGQKALPLELDTAYTQPCFALHCNLAKEGIVKPCPKMDTDREKKDLAAEEAAAGGALAGSGVAALLATGTGSEGQTEMGLLSA